jgi:cystathionine beta-lyase
MDYEDMEKKLKDQKIHTVIFCSPQNPMGRVWEKEEILKAMEIFEKYNVYIISDEVWSDIILFENKHVPTQSVNDYAKNHTIAFYSPSKAFNLSGLIGAYHIIYSQYIKDRLEKESSLSHYNNMSIISMYSLIGAYKPEAYDWLEQLLKVLTQNVEYAINYIRTNFKGISLTAPEGTYFLFIDCFEWCKENNKTIEEVEKAAWKVGVALQDGKMFNGNFHLRINLALPLSRVKEAFDRLNKYVFNKK